LGREVLKSREGGGGVEKRGGEWKHEFQKIEVSRGWGFYKVKGSLDRSNTNHLKKRSQEPARSDFLQEKQD